MPIPIPTKTLLYFRRNADTGKKPPRVANPCRMKLERNHNAIKFTRRITGIDPKISISPPC
jgi:hypothetical protein